jgi:peptidyl-prolyl cis-trans isomerase SurA
MKTISKLLPLLVLSASLMAKGKDPVLMHINEKPVYKSEFEYIYNKNNSNNSLDKKTLEEYVELFINFKLKVEEAKSQGLDTTKAFINELSGYRNQLTRPYLTDSKVEESIIREAYERLKEDVEVSHILIRIAPDATPDDTLKAWNKVNEIAKRVKTEDFAQVAKETSEDQSVTDNAGYIGWITGFRTVYPFEVVAYSTPVGTISGPVRTSFGYHIIKIHDRRFSHGEILVSHIMKFTSQGDEAGNARAKASIDSLYQLVKSGADFGEVAEANSEDRGSAARKGELPWFGVGRMVQEFEKAAFALKEKGAISEPVQSPYGWHIIKLIDQKGLPTFDEKKAEIERQVKRDERAQLGQLAFINKLKREYKLKVQKGDILSGFIAALEGNVLADSAFKSKAQGLNKPVMKFAGKTVTQSDFYNYLLKNASDNGKTDAGEIIRTKFNEFTNQQLLDYENSRLESKYSDFRLLMQEYHDGILLFEVSNNEVWEKASKDTAGLALFFRKNKENYKWEKPHFKGRVLQCKTAEVLEKAMKIVASQPTDSIDKFLRQLNDSVVNIKIEKGLYVQGDNKQVDFQVFKSGSQPEADAAYPFVAVPGKLLQTTPEEYTDVRGLVTADYQEYLEKEWIATLRNKYPVKVNQKVMSTVRKN